MKYSARDPPQARKLAGSRSIDLASRLCLFTTNHNGYNMVAESFGIANDACHVATAARIRISLGNGEKL